jgi:sodium-dependent dicarboxylate transporter 2/3/5
MTIKHNKDIIHVSIAVAIGLLIWFIVQPVNGLTTEGVTVLAVFIPTLYLWIMIGPISWVSILFLAVFAMTGIRTPGAIWAASVGHPTFILVTVFMLFDNCLRETGVIKYLADWFVSRKFAQGRPYLFLLMFFASNLILGIIMQNLALAIIYVTLASNLCKSIGIKKGDSLYTIIMLGTVWGNAVNHISSPIAKSIPNIVIGLVDTNLGINLTYVQWLMVGIPFIAVMIVVIIVCVRLYNPDVTALKNFDVVEFSKNVKPLGLRGKIAMSALIVLFLIIIIPEALDMAGFGNAVTDFAMSAGITTWVILIIVILNLIKTNEGGQLKPVMNFTVAVRDVNFGLMFFIAAVIFAGAPVGAESAGIVTAIGNLLEPVATLLPAIGIIALLCFFAIIMSNFMASTVVATIMFVTGVALFASQGVSPVSMAFVMVGSFAASMGVIMPASTASTALYYGEHIETKKCIKINILFLLLTLIGIVALTPLAIAVFR